MKTPEQKCAENIVRSFIDDLTYDYIYEYMSDDKGSLPEETYEEMIEMIQQHLRSAKVIMKWSR